MKLEFDTRLGQTTNPYTWESPHSRNPASDQVAPSTWVKLINPPTAFSFDEAWLLCQVSEQEWLGWVPDHGEILLNLDEFLVSF